VQQHRQQEGIKDGEGVYVSEVPVDGAAAQAGIKKGDVITKLNGVTLNSAAEMVGQIATYRPGDKVNVTFKREGEEKTVAVTLRNNTGTTEIVKNTVLDKLGADLQTLTKKDATSLGVKGGVVVKGIDEKGLFSKTRMEDGFIILKANGKEINTVEEFKKLLNENQGGSVKLEGVYPGYEGAFTYPLQLNSSE
jgi:serine protease Do